MIAVEQVNSVNECFFVIDKNFDVIIAQQKQIHFISIVANGHDECGVLVQRLNFIFQSIFS